jgi:hypothetical protein
MTHAKATPIPTPTFSNCLVPHSLSSSLTHALTAPQHSPRITRTQGTPPPSVVFSGLFHGHHQAPVVSDAPVSSTSSPTTRDTPQFALSPLSFTARAHRTLTMQPELHHFSTQASLRPHCCSSIPESPLEVRKLPTPLISRLLPVVYAIARRS